jgi:hypothetical protein
VGVRVVGGSVGGSVGMRVGYKFGGGVGMCDGGLLGTRVVG